MALPTVIFRTIGSAAGRDFATMPLWEDATDYDLVAANVIEVGLVYADSVFTAAVALAGATTDPGHFRVLMAAPGHEYDPITDTGVKIVSSTVVSTIELVEGYSCIVGIYFSTSVAKNANQAHVVGYTGARWYAERCLVKDTLSTADPVIGFFDISTAAFGRSCLAVGKDATNGLANGFRGNGSLVSWYRCVAMSCRPGAAPHGFYDNGAALGCVAVDNGTDFRIGATGNETYSASQDVSADGTGSITGVTAAAAFRNAAANDFRPPAGAPTIDKSVPFIPPFKPLAPALAPGHPLSVGIALLHLWADRVADVATDLSGRANHCTLAAGAGDAAWSRHFPGATISMDGGSATPMIVAQASGLPLVAAGAFSVAMWVRPDTVAAGVRALWSEQNAAGTTRYSLLCSAASVGLRVVDATNGTLEDTTSGTVDIGADRWHHVVLVDEGGAFRIYVDGFLRHSGSYVKASLAVGDLVQTRPFLNIGTAWTGHCASLMAWERALTTTEIQQQWILHPWELVGGDPPRDFSGTFALQGASLDMGAYEHVAAARPVASASPGAASIDKPVLWPGFRTARGQAAAYFQRKRHCGLMDPARGLFVTHRFVAADSGFDVGDRFPVRTAPVTFSVTIRRDASAAAHGIIFEAGDATTGLALWIAGNGQDVMAAVGDVGNGGATATVTSAVMAAGQTIRIVVSVVPGTGELRLWVNGRVARAASVTKPLPNGWAADSAAGIGQVSGAVSARVPAADRISLVGAAIASPIFAFDGQRPQHFGAA